MVVKSAVFVIALVSVLLTGCNPVGNAVGNTVYVRVLSDDGSPVAGANVTYRWSTGEAWGPGPNTATAHAAVVITDTGGLADARVTSEHYVSIDVASPGFYHSFVAVVDAGLGSHVTGGTALPIPLERIIAPRPLVAKKAWVILPSLSGTAPYDFLAGDLVAPLGKGRFPDCEIRWSPPIADSRIKQRELYDIMFTRPNAGIIARNVSTDRTIVESDFRSEKSAPPTGYVSSMRESETLAAPPATGAKDEGELIYYFCFIRNTSRLYGKILGEPQIIFFSASSHPVIQFTYAVNPSGDLSLEPDLKSISFPQTSGYEQPYTMPEPD